MANQLCLEEYFRSTTKTNRKCVWSQFSAFCASRQYELTAETHVEQLAVILLDWAYNMKKSDGEDYKESVVKTMWNVTARMLQEKFLHEYKIPFNPFQDIAFREARAARDVKRKELKIIPEKRKTSSDGLTLEELYDIRDIWDEETPVGLQRKLYHIIATELAWKGKDAVNALVEHFVAEVDESGRETGRIEYNPNFGKTSQTGYRTKSKWLTPNTTNPNHCPVRLFNKLIQCRPPTITSRIFLTPNSRWGRPGHRWYNSMPVGKNEIARWTKQAAEKIGIDTKKRKITNCSIRSTAVAHLSKTAVIEGWLGERNGHRNVDSIQSNADTNINPSSKQMTGDSKANPIATTIDSNANSIPTASNDSLIQGSVDSIQRTSDRSASSIQRTTSLIPTREDRSANSISVHPEMDIVLLQKMVDEMQAPVVVSNQTFVCEHIQSILDIAPSTMASTGRCCRSAPRIVFNNCTFNILPLKQ